MGWVLNTRMHDAAAHHAEKRTDGILLTSSRLVCFLRVSAMELETDDMDG